MNLLISLINIDVSPPTFLHSNYAIPRDRLARYVRPIDELFFVVIVESDRAVQLVNERLIQTGMQADLSQVVTIGKQQSRLFTYSHTRSHNSHLRFMCISFTARTMNKLILFIY